MSCIEAIETACKFAEKSLGRKLGRDVVVRMYGDGLGGVDVSPNEFVGRAFISEEVFYRLIDVSVVEVVGTQPVVFARISDHEPASLSKSWGGERGPFKQLYAQRIEDRKTR